MKASFYHVKLNVDEPQFYKDLLLCLGFNIYLEYDNGFGADDGKVSIWVFKVEKGHEKEVNFKDTGLNHLAFRVPSKDDVDNFYKEYLQPNNVKILSEPAEHPHYNGGKGYYAVFFEDPDHIKLEVAWIADE